MWWFMNKEFEFRTLSWSPTFHFLCNNIQINSISLISPDTVEDVIGSSRIVIVWTAASWSLISGQNICRYSSQCAGRVSTVTMGKRWREESRNFDEPWSCEKYLLEHANYWKWSGVGVLFENGRSIRPGYYGHWQEHYSSLNSRFSVNTQSMTPGASIHCDIDKISPGAGSRWKVERWAELCVGLSLSLFWIVSMARSVSRPRSSQDTAW